MLYSSSMAFPTAPDSIFFTFMLMFPFLLFLPVYLWQEKVYHILLVPILCLARGWQCLCWARQKEHSQWSGCPIRHWGLPRTRSKIPPLLTDSSQALSQECSGGSSLWFTLHFVHPAYYIILICIG